jgi:hypothetical protein
VFRVCVLIIFIGDMLSTTNHFEQFSAQNIGKDVNVLYARTVDPQLADHNERITRKHERMDAALACETKTRSPQDKLPRLSVFNFDQTIASAPPQGTISSLGGNAALAGPGFIFEPTMNRRPPASSTSTHVPDAVVRLPRLPRFASWVQVEAGVNGLLTARSGGGELSHQYSSHTFTWICTHAPAALIHASALLREMNSFTFTVTGVSVSGGFALEVRAVGGDNAPLAHIVSALEQMATGNEIELKKTDYAGTGSRTGGAPWDGGNHAPFSSGSSFSPAPVPAVAEVVTVSAPAPAPAPAPHLEYLLLPLLDMLASRDGKTLLDGCRTASEVSLHPEAFARETSRLLPAEVRRQMVSIGFVEALARVVGGLARGGKDEERQWTVVYALTALEQLAWDASHLRQRLPSSSCLAERAISMSSQETQETHTTCESSGSAAAAAAAADAGSMASLLQVVLRLSTADTDTHTGTGTDTGTDAVTDAGTDAGPDALPLFHAFAHALHCRAVSIHLLLRFIRAHPAWVRHTLGADALQAVMTYWHQPALAPTLALPHRPPIADLLASAAAAIDDDSRNSSVRASKTVVEVDSQLSEGY